MDASTLGDGVLRSLTVFSRQDVKPSEDCLLRGLNAQKFWTQSLQKSAKLKELARLF